MDEDFVNLFLKNNQEILQLLFNTENINKISEYLDLIKRVSALD